MAITAANRVREAIIKLNGAEFTYADMPKVNNPQSVLYKMANITGEIEHMRDIVTGEGGRPVKVYKEIRVKLRGPKSDMPQSDPLEYWKKCVPEWFPVPQFKGQSRIYDSWNNG